MKTMEEIRTEEKGRPNGGILVIMDVHMLAPFYHQLSCVLR